ncbi:MAG TPA: hypothetical protein PKA41_16910 [Verrucomicrobiota bacterium]|mgnify:CR=1 FL=1|nr:hypothetical protein [Verrucomicrobiota bacterium]
MTLPENPVTLTVEQIKELNQKLSHMRHDINNHLSLMMAATELMRHKPQTAERMLEALNDRPKKISETMAAFSVEFEQALSIRRG